MMVVIRERGHQRGGITWHAGRAWSRLVGPSVRPTAWRLVSIGSRRYTSAIHAEPLRPSAPT